MGWYEKHVLPKLIEMACSQPPMKKLRARYVPLATGKVLEIGIGSGLNLCHYMDQVESITGLDPSRELTALAESRAADIVPPVNVLQIPSEEIPADDASFDSVVCTWTLCTIPNVYRALQEIYRVVKPGGRFYFVEHGLSPDISVQRWQRRIEPLWKIIGGGCHLTRDASRLIRDTGFLIPEIESGYKPGPKWAAYMSHGIAQRPK
ncbi:MAG: class I SAM-dependent methyltransferase [Pseudomonadales bacterium]|nr:class I SAM-dependent methyltransferase [Pseudomonadales bacterium]